MTLLDNKDNTFTLTHYSGVSITFVRGLFNESQQIYIPDDFNTDATTLASIMRELGDWMARNHYDLVFGG